RRREIAVLSPGTRTVVVDLVFFLVEVERRRRRRCLDCFGRPGPGRSFRRVLVDFDIDVGVGTRGFRNFRGFRGVGVVGVSRRGRGRFVGLTRGGGISGRVRVIVVTAAAGTRRRRVVRFDVAVGGGPRRFLGKL